MEKATILENLFEGEAESNRDLLRCSMIPACDGRKTFVHDLNRTFGNEYKANARIAIIGESPGIQENEKGRPFIGQSGHIIDKELKKIGIERDDVYLTNAVKCHPTDEMGKTRAPTDEEIDTCAPLLKRELEIVRPKVIIAMGRAAIKSLVGIPSISRAIKQGEINALGTIIVPTYHPAAGLHGSLENLFIIKESRERAFKRAKEISESKGEPKKPKTLLDYLE